MRECVLKNNVPILKIPVYWLAEHFYGLFFYIKQTLILHGLIFLNSQFSLMEPVISFWMFKVSIIWKPVIWFAAGLQMMEIIFGLYSTESWTWTALYSSVQVFEQKMRKFWEWKTRKLWINGFNIHMMNKELIRFKTPTRKQFNLYYIMFLAAVSLLNYFS